MSSIDDIIASSDTDEVEGDFDLLDHLRHQDMRTADVTVFYDEKRGEQYQQVQAALSLLETAVDISSRAGDDGVATKKLAEFEEQSAKAEEFKTALLKHSATFHLRAVPPVIVKDVLRKSRQALGITEKGASGREDELNDRIPLELAAAQVVSLVDNRTGKSKTDVSADYLEELSGLLPRPQWFKLLDAVNDLQNRNVFAGVKVDNVDFSQGI